MISPPDRWTFDVHAAIYLAYAKLHDYQIDQGHAPTHEEKGRVHINPRLHAYMNALLHRIFISVFSSLRLNQTTAENPAHIIVHHHYNTPYNEPRRNCHIYTYQYDAKELLSNDEIIKLWDDAISREPTITSFCEQNQFRRETSICCLGTEFSDIPCGTIVLNIAGLPPIVNLPYQKLWIL